MRNDGTTEASEGRAKREVPRLAPGVGIDSEADACQQKQKRGLCPPRQLCPNPCEKWRTQHRYETTNGPRNDQGRGHCVGDFNGKLCLFHGYNVPDGKTRRKSTTKTLPALLYSEARRGPLCPQ